MTLALVALAIAADARQTLTPRSCPAAFSHGRMTRQGEVLCFNRRGHVLRRDWMEFVVMPTKPSAVRAALRYADRLMRTGEGVWSELSGPRGWFGQVMVIRPHDPAQIMNALANELAQAGLVKVAPDLDQRTWDDQGYYGLWCAEQYAQDHHLGLWHVRARDRAKARTREQSK